MQGPFYIKANKALDEAHKACLGHLDRDVLGMSSGPFSGVNEALGIIKKLEDENRLLRNWFLNLESFDSEKKRYIEYAKKGNIMDEVNTKENNEQVGQLEGTATTPTVEVKTEQVKEKGAEEKRPF